MARPLAIAAEIPAPRLAGRSTLPWLALLALTALLVLASDLAPWAFKYPTAWVVPLKSWINALMEWLRNDATFGLFTFQQLTRAISWLIEQPFRLASAMLSEGFVAGAGHDGVVMSALTPDFSAAPSQRSTMAPQVTMVMSSPSRTRLARPNGSAKSSPG